MNSNQFNFDSSFGYYSQLPDIPRYVSDLSLSKKLILHIYPLLNKHHQINQSYSYWLALLIPSTQILVESIFDRFQINIDPDAFPFIDLKDDFLCADHQSLNYNLIKDIIIFRSGGPTPSEINIPTNPYLSTSPSKTNFKNKLVIRTIIKKISKVFSTSLPEIISYRIYLVRQIIYYLLTRSSSKIHHGFIIQQVLSATRFKKLEHRLKQLDIHYLPLNRLPSILVKHHDCSVVRKTNIDFSFESNNPQIIKFISSHYTKYLPTFALEEFQSYYKFFKGYSCQKLVVKCSNSLEPSFRHAFAALSQSSTQIINFQHGGGYGLYDAALHNLEKQLSDLFVSWRDDNLRGYRGLVTGYAVRPNVKSNHKTNVQDVLIIAPFFKPFHRYNIGVHPFYNNLIATRIIELIKLLLANNFNVTYRPYSKSHDQISKYFGFRISTDSIEKQISSSHHIVICKPTTAPTECLIQGKLPILFFGEEEHLNYHSQKSISILAKYGFYVRDAQSCYNSILRDVINQTPTDSLHSVKNQYDSLFGSRISSVDEVIEVISKNLNNYSSPYNIIRTPRITM